jgi:hypothetical protein
MISLQSSSESKNKHAVLHKWEWPIERSLLGPADEAVEPPGRGGLLGPVVLNPLLTLDHPIH